MPEARVTAAQRRAVFKRAKCRCEYCLTPEAFVPDPFALEHIWPRSKGGRTRLDNLALACIACNSHKYNLTEAIDPVSQKLVPLFHPRKQRWSEHFAWSDDGLSLIGLTPIGRATIDTLQMNHAKMINYRRLLLLAGLQPPNEA